MRISLPLAKRAVPQLAITLSLACSMLSTTAAAQTSDRPVLLAYVDSATALMERWSVNRAKIDWPALRAAARAMIDSASNPDTSVAYAAVRDALVKLGDHHSFLLNPVDVQGLNDPSPAINAPPSIRIISGNIGYAGIPAYSGFDSIAIQRYTIDFQAQLQRIAGRASCGWVVDLRGNTGGNMWPMLTGIGPVLGNGLAGLFVSPDSTDEWGYTNGSAWAGVDTIVKVPTPLVLPFASHPVAVLTDSMTGSSGEGIAIAFRDRPRTRSFGAPTYGATTGNEEYALPDGGMLFLATVVVADRSGTLFGGKLIPDSLIAPENALPVAAAWLTSEACPGPS